ncbi:MAG TPA: DUF4394 domain-containing protein [Chthoniobacterales bacterium]
MKTSSLAACTLAAILVFTAAPARATTTYALTNGGDILTFDHATPQTATSVTPDVAVVGAYVLLAIDIRPTVQTTSPANPGAGTLWAIGRSGTTFQLFVIDPANGAATAIGAPILAGIDSTPGVNTWGFDFNPSTDRIRLVNTASTDDNYRLNPNNGTLQVSDPSLTYIPGDPNAATPPQLDAVAYTTAAFGGTSTLYGIDVNLGILARAVSADAGTFQTVGSLGVAIDQPNGFDIYQSLALFSVPTVTGSALYSVNLSTGAAALVGDFAPGTNIRGLAISTAEPVPPLDTKPVLDIFGKTKRTTRVSPAIVRGVATDESGSVALSYRVSNRSASFYNAPFAGTNPFAIKVRRLARGENRVTIRATDPTGHNTQKTIRIIRR